MKDKDSLVVELLKESREQQKELLEASTKHREETSVWQVETSHRLENIEEDLREHKEGVIQNREAMKIFNARLDALEAPKKAFKTITKMVGAIAGLCISILGIIKLIEYLNK